MNISLHKKKSAGFTLIETLFAVLIFSAALVSLMAIAGRGISAANSARDQVIAHYLAQEGMEVVRNIRDSNFLTGTAWTEGIDDCTETDPCTIEYDFGSGASVPGLDNGNGDIYWNGLFYETNGDPTQFRRTIVVEDTGVLDDYRVTTTVSWTTKGLERSVVLTTLLKNWYGPVQ